MKQALGITVVAIVFVSLVGLFVAGERRRLRCETGCGSYKVLKCTGDTVICYSHEQGTYLEYSVLK